MSRSVAGSSSCSATSSRSMVSSSHRSSRCLGPPFCRLPRPRPVGATMPDSPMAPGDLEALPVDEPTPAAAARRHPASCRPPRSSGSPTPWSRAARRGGSSGSPTQGAGLVSGWLDGDPVGADRASGALARRLVDAGLVHPRPVDDGDPCAARSTRRPGPRRRRRARGRAARRCRGPRRSTWSWSTTARSTPRRWRASRRARRDARPPRGARAGPARHGTSDCAASDRADRGVPRRRRACRRHDWLEGLLPYFDDPAVGAVAPRVRGPLGETGARALRGRRLAPRPGDPRPASSGPARRCRSSPPPRSWSGAPPSSERLRRVARGRRGRRPRLAARRQRGGRSATSRRSSSPTPPARRGAAGSRSASPTGCPRRRSRRATATPPRPLRADPRVLATLGLVLAGRPRAAARRCSAGPPPSLARQLEGVRGPRRQRGGGATARRARDRARGARASRAARSAPTGRSLVAAAVGVVAAAPAGRRARGRPRRPCGGGARGDRRRGPRSCALSVADDLAYGAGVLAGAVRARRAGRAAPRLRPASSAASPISRT